MNGHELNIIAFDLSLTNTGHCNQQGTTNTIQPPKKIDGQPCNGTTRLRWFYAAIRAMCITAHIVAIEGYGYNSKSGNTLAELGGIAKLAIAHAGAQELIIAPTSLKKYATGKGNAPKAAMVSAATLRADKQFETDDEADAWWLWTFAHDLHNQPIIKLPQTNRTALDKYRTGTTT